MSTSMLAQTSRTATGVWRATRSWTLRQLCRHATTRRYAVDAAYAANDEPEWFQQVRAEMRGRETTYHLDDITVESENRLANTFAGFLKDKWCRPADEDRSIVTPGHHLVAFNPSLPADRMLPDGTDMSQSPGDPWVRRMWAGGSVTFKPDYYYSSTRGYQVNQAMACAERIMDVRLRGQGDSAKIFVTIERRFARTDQLYEAHKMRTYGGSGKVTRKTVAAHFKAQLANDEEWGDAMLKEKRELVFFKERSAAELEAFKAGQLPPVKYLDRPDGKPQMSFALTPTRSLLFRFSALTFNAHLIHLDRDYARNVEGHRNLLVHGPLSLTFMLKAISNYVKVEAQDRELVERIEYRNLAPLYCDEEMRISAGKKTMSESGSTWDIWIEGPTGGVAVKGTVQTVMRRKEPSFSENKRLKRKAMNRHANNARNKTESGLVEGWNSAVRIFPIKDAKTTSEPQSSNVLPSSGDVPLAETDQLTAWSDVETERVDMRDSRSLSPAPPYYRRNRVRSYQFMHPVQPIRRVDTYQPLRLNISPTSRYLINRIIERRPKGNPLEPQPVIRPTRALPYVPYDPQNDNTFEERGVRKIFEGSVRLVVPSNPSKYRKPRRHRQ